MFAHPKNNTDNQARFACDLAYFLSNNLTKSEKPHCDKTQLRREFQDNIAGYGFILGGIGRAVLWVEQKINH
jgi:hypothetical protein